jgi:hypothetical protein
MNIPEWMQQTLKDSFYQTHHEVKSLCTACAFQNGTEAGAASLLAYLMEQGCVEERLRKPEYLVIPLSCIDAIKESLKE